MAAFLGDVARVKAFLEEGADINAEDKLGHTALHYATGADRREVVELLLARGADVNAGEWTPLHVAVQTGRTDIAACLIDAGADVSGGSKRAPLREAAWGYNTDIVELLIAKGADVNAGALHTAVGAGQTAIAELLIAKGANINRKGAMGLTPLHRAALEAPHLVGLLISKGADVHMKDNEGRTPLSMARDKGHTEIVEFLRKHGAKE
jgi:cytohesin